MYNNNECLTQKEEAKYYEVVLRCKIDNLPKYMIKQVLKRADLVYCNNDHLTDMLVQLALWNTDHPCMIYRSSTKDEFAVQIGDSTKYYSREDFPGIWKELE